MLTAWSSTLSLFPTRVPVSEGTSAVTHTALQRLWSLLILSSQTVQRPPPRSPLDQRLLLGALVGQVWTETIKRCHFLLVVILNGEVVCLRDSSCLGPCSCLTAALSLTWKLIWLFRRAVHQVATGRQLQACSPFAQAAASMLACHPPVTLCCLPSNYPGISPSTPLVPL